MNYLDHQPNDKRRRHRALLSPEGALLVPAREATPSKEMAVAMARAISRCY